MKPNTKNLRLLKKKRNKKNKEAKLIQQILPQSNNKQTNGCLKESTPDDALPTVHETTEKKKRKRHKYTVSIALPGSIMLTHQTLEMKTILAGQIARAAAVFGVDEIIVFDEDGLLPTVADCDKEVDMKLCTENILNNVDKNPAILLAILLQFMECPQYLRKSLFPQHEILSKTGLMAPLGIPSHAKQDDVVPYREGLVVPSSDNKTIRQQNKKVMVSNLIDVGLNKPLESEAFYPVKSRLTIRMSDHASVSRREPLKLSGLYWGYTVRLVNKLSGVLRSRYPASESEGATQSHEYDLIVGTSERGSSVDHYTMPAFKHLLIIFGGVHGLEKSLYLDEELSYSFPGEFCHSYLNTCPKQGSNTIRTEEAIFVTLSALRPHIVRSRSFKM